LLLGIDDFDKTYITMMTKSSVLFALLVAFTVGLSSAQDFCASTTGNYTVVVDLFAGELGKFVSLFSIFVLLLLYFSLI
jgi:hypothetical protein